MKTAWLLAFSILLGAMPSSPAAARAASPEPAPATGVRLQQGDVVAIVGDSITEQKMYSRILEDYLLACVPQLELTVVQLGWSGEQAVGFLQRIDKDLFPFQPNLVTLCYGMNDGQYRLYEASLGETYAKALKEIVERIQEKGADVIVGSPGIVDAQFARPNLSFEQYNANLGELSNLARGIAREQNAGFADIHGVLIGLLKDGIAKYGPSYHLTYDGIHPKLNGHLGMAYAFLKSMGVTGEIGAITLRFGKTASASEGHSMLACDGTKMDIESLRYPFCFVGDETSPDSPRSALPLIPFHNELNRFMLVVKGLSSAGARVTWGAATKEFSKHELAKGVNLAAEFPDNPFSERFAEVDAAVMRKQAFETVMVKELDLARIGALLGPDDEVTGALELLKTKFQAKHKELQAAIREIRTPVRHSIEVAPL